MMGAFPNDPAKRQEVLDIYFLALTEIVDGGSERHEIDLATWSIEEMIDQVVDQWERLLLDYRKTALGQTRSQRLQLWFVWEHG
jgi:hypothetical protein